MSETPVVFDGRVRKAKLRKDKMVSMRCVNCGKRRYVLSIELIRAAAPRCLSCGGATEEIERSKKRRGLYAAAVRQAKASRRCPGCGQLIVSNQALRFHLMGDRDCLKYHRDEGKCIEFQMHRSVIPGTVEVFRSSGYWVIVGLSGIGELLEIYRARTKYECDDVLQNELGPVEFAR